MVVQPGAGGKAVAESHNQEECQMVKIETYLGSIQVSNMYFANLISHAVSECYGVSGLTSSTPVQGLRTRFSRKDMRDKGVRVRHRDGRLTIDLHIAVTYGVNIAAIVKSIVNKVAYTVETACGLHVDKVNVFVAEMIPQ